MSRLIGTVALLLVVALMLPVIATAAWAAVPTLVSLLVALALIRLGLPSSRRR